MEILVAAVKTVNGYIWGLPTVSLLLLVGVYLTIGLRFFSLRKIPYGFRELFSKTNAQKNSSAIGEISPAKALMLALSATIGTGSIAGVAIGITVAGPGIIFWMWITAVFGMATKFTEVFLAVKYREKDFAGRTVGGPMYYIKNGLPRRWRWMSITFALCGTVSGLTAANFIQSNSIADVIGGTYGVSAIYTGFTLLFFSAAVIVGGVKKIAVIAAALVPTMTGMYLVGGAIILGLNSSEIPEALALILRDAFGYEAATGGFAWGAFWAALRFGVARGAFSSEAGLGTAPIAHAAAKNHDPISQGSIAMLGTFLDTLLICTMTGLVILTSGIWEYGDTGARLTAAAYEAHLPHIGGQLVSICLVFFAFTTILGWSYYGERCAEFLFGENAVWPYRAVYLLTVFAGAAVLTLDQAGEQSVIVPVWLMVDVFTGLMAIPNLIALLLLSPIAIEAVKNVDARYSGVQESADEFK